MDKPPTPPRLPARYIVHLVTPLFLTCWKGSGKGGDAESCVVELARSNSVEGFGLFKDALENDRPYKQAVVKGLRDVLPNSWQPSEAELLNIVNERLAGALVR